MQKFLYKIRTFMYGRNGIDGLGIFLFVIYFILNNISYFMRNFILNILCFLILFYMIYRVFSRNIVNRRKENDFFMCYYRKICSWFSNQSFLARERAKINQTHKIYLCPKCKRKLKVPKKKGKIEISCPCGNKFFKRT